jgi:ABC-2 type transport system permease protein
MNLHTTGIIIRREYLNKVKKKSFLLITFLSPILFAALCILPSLIMLGTKEEAKKIAVVDKSGIVMPMLEDTETIDYTDCSVADVESLKAGLKEMGFDAVLSISELDSTGRSLKSEVFSSKPLGVDMTENINRRIDDAVEAYRIDSYGIDDLGQIMKDVKASVSVQEYTLDDSGGETVSESGIYMMMSMILGIIIFLFITLFGGMVMSSVIEEKSSRVVEVLISSAKATELMFGKIIGVAMVALTQFLLWIVLSVVLLGVFRVIFGDRLFPSDPQQVVSAMGVDPAAAESLGVPTADLESMMTAPADTLAAAAPQNEMSVVLSTLANVPWGQLIISFFIYFILGYLLYASFFAAIGSAVENEADTQQLQIPLTIPLMLGYFIALIAFRNPESGVVVWGSMIPFTSPIVMLSRIPYGVPMWELILSIALLALTFIACAWLSAKIYKAGILVFGKKSTFADLWKWIKQK